MLIVDAYTHVGAADASVLEWFRPVEERGCGVSGFAVGYVIALIIGGLLSVIRFFAPF